MAEKWYPVIDYSVCAECGTCVNMCPHNVYDVNKAPAPVVVNPEGCVDGCHGCGNKCPEGAITYVGDNTGWKPPHAVKTESEQSCGCSENIITDKEETRNFIRKRYSSIASKSSASGCCSGGCSCNSTPTDISDKIGYTKSDLLNAPSESNMGLGCGNPLAIAALKEGETVLDLGSGGGFDCFLARNRVGETGHVIGVDMTPDMIELARKNVKKSNYTNIEFRLGEIEHLPVENETVDVIISNCVINLSLDKEQVFKEAYRVLKRGGRLSVSDVVATATLPDQVKKDLVMIAGCIAGAEHMDSLKAMLQNAGFKNIKLMPKDNSKEIIKSWAPGSNIEDYVASFIIEATK